MRRCLLFPIVPDTEREMLLALISAESLRFGLSSEEYLRKVWYHDQARKLGEHVASIMLDWLLRIVTGNVP